MLATAGHPDQEQRLWTWRSADGGRTWQISAAPAPPGMTGVTVDQHGDLMVLGEFPGTWRGGGKGARPDVCGVVWLGRIGALRRQELGCIDARGISAPTGAQESMRP